MYNVRKLTTGPRVLTLGASPTQDWPWPNWSRSLKMNGLEGLANLSPCAKYERCRPNGSPDITYKRLAMNQVKVTPNQWTWRVWFANVSHCTKCRSNSSQDITYQRWRIRSRSPKIDGLEGDWKPLYTFFVFINIFPFIKKVYTDSIIMWDCKKSITHIQQ